MCDTRSGILRPENRDVVELRRDVYLLRSTPVHGRGE